MKLIFGSLVSLRHSTTSHRSFVPCSTDHQREVICVHQRNTKTASSTVSFAFIERLFKYKTSPRSWTEATLDVAVRWLLRQCGRIETEARRKSIELVCTFIPLLPGSLLRSNSQLIIKPVHCRDSKHSRIFRSESEN